MSGPTDAQIASIDGSSPPTCRSPPSAAANAPGPARPALAAVTSLLAVGVVLFVVAALNRRRAGPSRHRNRTGKALTSVG